jgi:hypothetical protein
MKLMAASRGALNDRGEGARQGVGKGARMWHETWRVGAERLMAAYLLFEEERIVEEDLFHVSAG